MEQPTGRMIAAARALARVSQDELAGAANISTGTLKRFEGERGGIMRNNLHVLRAALEARGVRFIETPEGPGVVLVAEAPAEGSADR